MGQVSKSYYLKPVKIIRDSVHGYVNLTRFDLELIDTVPFQRLGDVRQLTCQHVYPGARHTRFEHSLGVLELMRSAIKYLNRNRFLGGPPCDDAVPGRGNTQIQWPINESLEFNASIAALLHDVGHCPFSHMGETQFNKDAVRQDLVNEVRHYKGTVEDGRTAQDCDDLITELDTRDRIGAIHEQLSCIVILRKYRAILSNLRQPTQSNEDVCEITADFVLIVRSILGIEYKVDTVDKFKENQLKNVIVRLLNSPIFDVDKLDYIMRDSYLTGIGTPVFVKMKREQKGAKKLAGGGE